MYLLDTLSTRTHTMGLNATYLLFNGEKEGMEITTNDGHIMQRINVKWKWRQFEKENMYYELWTGTTSHWRLLAIDA